MNVVYSRDHLIHNPQWEIFQGERIPHVERPERIESIIASLKGSKHPILSPGQFSTRYIYSVHTKNYVDYIKRLSGSLQEGQSLYPSYYILDTYTPILSGTYKAAKNAVNCALTGAQLIRKEQQIAYALCRPPGHHSEKDRLGGYCYFNNAAIATEYLSQFGTVAILDIDFHHGNGTQHIFYNRSDVLYVSIHADPSVRYPYISGFSSENGTGEGLGFNKNYPLPLGTRNDGYRKTLQRTLTDIKKFSPSFLVVSAGFDTYINDPIGGFNITMPFYKIIGRDIASLRLPTLIVQEGGYEITDLGEIASNFIEGFT